MRCATLIGRSGYLFCVIAAMTISACGPARHTEPRRGSLAEYAKQAKREGRSSTTVTELFDEYGSESNLDDLLGIYSALLVIPARISALQTVEDEYIHTWHVFRVLQVLSSRSVPAPPAFPGCRLPLPAQLSLESAEVAVPVAGGTAVIDDVIVRMETNAWNPVEPGQHYLLLAIMCPGGVVILPMGGPEVFDVTPNGRILREYANPSIPPDFPLRFRFEKEMLSLGTIDRLAAHIKDIERKKP
jgi:hypothetical protein